ncbi:MAG: hypothetical protein JWN48_5866 [Myxococcaceae bacterium]|nr:hypothetical protein [Myxococcaceae bacterium]
MTEQSESMARRPIDDARELVKEEQREISAILTHMWENGEILLRQELDLGLKEIDLRVDRLKQSLLMAAIGGLAVYAGLLALLAALIFGLSKVMEPWLASLVVGGVLTAAGATFLMRSEAKAEQAVKPDEHSHRTARAMKEAIK